LNRLNVDLKDTTTVTNTTKVAQEEPQLVSQTDLDDSSNLKGYISPKIVDNVFQFKQMNKQKLRKEKHKEQLPMSTPVMEKLNMMNNKLSKQCEEITTEESCTKMMLCGWCTQAEVQCLLGDAKGPALASACHHPAEWHVVKRTWDVPTQVWAAAQMKVYEDNRWTLEPHKGLPVVTAATATNMAYHSP